jgi:ABC-type microcin C transport system permease subunit YejB
MAYDSALAQLTINMSNVIPRNFVAEEYVNLVYDNFDFGKEIAKQTHVTNVIITQKMAVQIENGLPHIFYCYQEVATNCGSA